MRFTGLSAFLLTPANEEGHVDTTAVRRLVAHAAEAGLSQVCVLGSTGTYAYLTREERRRTIHAATEECRGRLTILAGIGALRTDAAIALGQDAREAGADAVLLAPISYTKLTPDEVFTHTEAVASATNLPLCIYNNPGSTNFAFQPDLVGRLAALPHVVALKTPAPATDLATWRAATPPGFSVGYSMDWLAAAALLAGGDAWYSVAAGLFPRACLALTTAAQSHNAAAAQAANARLQPLWALFEAHTSLRVIYAAARLRGLIQTQPPRPLLPLPAHLEPSVAKAIEGLD